MMQRKFRRGFTLIEAAAVTAIGTLVAATLAPGLKANRLNAQARGSESNLMQIGQGSDMYALDNAGRIYSYSWQARVFYDMPDGSQRQGVDDQQAAALQNEAILEILTGRAFKNGLTRLPHTRMRSLVLIDYLNRVPEDPMFADPADANLLQWQQNPTDISSANNIPYAPGSDTTGYDDPTGWTDLGQRERWPYTSSYLSTTAAWAPDGLNGEPTAAPVSSTPHLHQMAASVSLANGRNSLEVTFPSAKVHLFEEFDREQAGSPYFAYDHARPAKLMFDGSVNDWASGAARPSWSPATSKVEWRQRYVPIHTFPVPLSGLGETTLLSQRYRWTLGGLKGVDYSQPLMPAGR